MINYTQEMLDALIECRKTIVVPPKREMSSRMGSLRNDMKAQSADLQQFHVFMRQSEAFEEDFSIGLRYTPTDDSDIVLLRCNGPHEFVNSIPGTSVPDNFHTNCHIHRAKKENLEEGRKAESGTVITTAYTTFTQALRHFLKITNIKWTPTDFPRLDQLDLDFE